MAAGRQIDNTEHDQQTRRNDRTDQTADLGHFTDPAQTLKGDECSCPVDHQHDDQRIHFIGSQSHIGRRMHADKGDRYRAEGQYGRIPDRTLDPLEPNGQKACPGTHSLTDPAEHAALFVGEHGGQLGSHQCGRNQENQRGEQIVKSRRGSVNRLCRQSTQAHNGSDIHNCKCHDTQFEPCAFSCCHTISI